MINKSQIIKSTKLNGGETETIILHRGMYFEVGWGRVGLYVMHDYGVEIIGFSINLTKPYYPIPFDELEEAMDFLAENWWKHESEIIDELKPYVKETIQKNSTNTFHVLDKKMLEDYDSFVIVGCCSDICVMQFALSLKTYLNQMNMDKKVCVPLNCIATYDAPLHSAEEYHKMALNIMAQSGIIIDEMR